MHSVILIRSIVVLIVIYVATLSYWWLLLLGVVAISLKGYFANADFMLFQLLQWVT